MVTSVWKDTQQPPMKVPYTAEFQRIEDLPRVDFNVVGTEWRQNLQDALATSHGTMQLLPWQAAALVYTFQYGGLFTAAGVGAGKTLVSLLIPVIMGALRPLLMLPAAAREKTYDEIPMYRRHFKLHAHLQIMSYEELSRISGVDALNALRPDIIVCDEAHRLKALDAARTRRFTRYFKANPKVKFAGMSGTPTTTSLHEYAHFLRLALGADAPVPRTQHELDMWADAIDKAPQRIMQSGVLERWCEPGENVQQGWQRRLGSTPGIILTTSSSSDAKIQFDTRTPPVPENVAQAIKALYNKWVTPGGEECRYAMELWRHGRELSCGFYYRWVWPKDRCGVEQVNEEWMLARAAWFKFVRHVIQYNTSRAKQPLDSPKAVENAVVNGDIYSDEYSNWMAIRDEYTPAVEPVWLNDFLVDDVIAEARTRNALVWVEHQAFGARLWRKGFPYLGPKATQREIVESRGSVALSQKAHCEIKNLQNRCDNIVVSPSASGAQWEQLIGRTHRQGQKSDTVRVTTYAHTHPFTDSMESAFAAAVYMQNSMGQPQKLLTGGFL